MRRRKNFEDPGPSAVVSKPEFIGPRSPNVYIGNHVMYSGEHVQLVSWLGLGSDEWVWEISEQLKEFARLETQSRVSLFTYGTNSLPQFFRFLLSAQVQKLP